MERTWRYGRQAGRATSELSGAQCSTPLTFVKQRCGCARRSEYAIIGRAMQAIDILFDAGEKDDG